MKIALLGYGNIGSGVYTVLQNHTDNFEKFLVKHDRTGELFTRNFDEILSDESIETIVDTMSDDQASYEYVTAAMKAGKNVVTSNKELVSRYLKELLDLAEENGVIFLFESTVGAGIPWIDMMNEYKQIK